MKLQEKDYSCLPAALRSALYSLGHKVSESTVRKKAGTTKEGTDENGAFKAINYYGHTAKGYQFFSYNKAWNWLNTCQKQGKPILMCTDNWRHWVSSNGKFGAKIWIFDPDSTTPERRKRYSGLELYSKEKWKKRWWYYNRSTKKYSYYGICITS